MTYMPDNEFSPLSTDRDVSTTEKLKVLTKEGAERSQRVLKILRTAFTETVVEVQDGRAVISPLAKEVTAETVATVKDKSQQAATVFSQTWEQDSDQDDLTERVIAFVRNLINTGKVKLFPQLKNQAVKLDGALSDRYGQRYESIKTRFDFVLAWCESAEPTTPETAAYELSEPTIVIEVDSEVVR